MHRLFRIKAYEAEHGPHFDEEMARKAVSKMENEDGSRGQHWSIEETTSLANQHGIRKLAVYNPEIARAAAYGAFAGENYGLNTQCGCC